MSEYGWTAIPKIVRSGEERYTTAEIMRAAGTARENVERWRRQCGIAASPTGYTLEEAYRIIMCRKAIKLRPSAENVKRLVRRLNERWKAEGNDIEIRAVNGAYRTILGVGTENEQILK